MITQVSTLYYPLRRMLLGEFDFEIFPLFLFLLSHVCYVLHISQSFLFNYLLVLKKY
jgi:hypothetical protein